jgi:hypothetical protein
MGVRQSALGVLAATLLVLACSSSQDSGPTTDTACSSFAATLCATTQMCNAAAVTIAFGSVDDCKARLVASCTAAASAPSTGITPAKIQSCADAEKSLACSEYYKTGISTVCQPITGSLANGSPCLDDAQCQTSFCTKAANTLCGTCAAPPAAGAPCANGKCPNGLRCNASDVCAAAATSGQKCTGSADCEGDLTCNVGLCGKPAQNGEACSLQGDTAAACDPLAALWCNTVSKKCEPYKIAAAGAACGLDTTTGGLTTCDATAYCQVVDAKTFKGTCVARTPDGAACKMDALGGGASCQALAVCDNGVCRVPEATACNK